MAEVTARHDAACCLMHNRKEAVYGDFLQDVISDMKECLALADDAGVASGKILLDPGVGFAKSLEQNLQITKHVDLLKALGCPVLLGTSRKSMIGLSLDLPGGSAGGRHAGNDGYWCYERLRFCACA